MYQIKFCINRHYFAQKLCYILFFLPSYYIIITHKKLFSLLFLLLCKAIKNDNNIYFLGITKTHTKMAQTQT